MSEIETNFFDGLVGFTGLGVPIAGGAGDLDCRRFHCGSVSLDGDGVVPFRREIDFSGRRGRFGGGCGFIDDSKLGFGGGGPGRSGSATGAAFSSGCGLFLSGCVFRGSFRR